MQSHNVPCSQLLTWSSTITQLVTLTFCACVLHRTLYNSVYQKTKLLSAWRVLDTKLTIMYLYNIQLQSMLELSMTIMWHHKDTVHTCPYYWTSSCDTIGHHHVILLDITWYSFLRALTSKVPTNRSISPMTPPWRSHQNRKQSQHKTSQQRFPNLSRDPTQANWLLTRWLTLLARLSLVEIVLHSSTYHTRERWVTLLCCLATLFMLP